MLTTDEIETIRGTVISELNRIGKLPAPKPTAAYRIALVAASLIMVLLPLVYFALCGAVGYGIFRYAEKVPKWISNVDSAWGVIAILLPCVAGCVMLVFMIKPLFVRRANEVEPYVLNREDEPFFFAFVSEVARIVGAPQPREIRLTTEVNAAAAFRKGFWSVLQPRGDLMLLVGIPLLQGLSMRELAGVLAHEFGHFNQGGGMRLTYVVRRINHWFARVVYERDQWDETLERFSRNVDFRLMVLIWIIRGGIWITRRVLWCIMWIGNVVTCFLLRQMEFDADRCEVLLAGADCFADTSDQVIKLSLVESYSVSLAMSLLQGEGRLADDWGAFILDNVDEIPADKLQEALKESREAPTQWFDTHPSTADRVAAAHRLGNTGFFQLQSHRILDELIAKGDDSVEPPTLNSTLLNDHDAIARELTWRLYNENLAIPPKRDQLVPANELRAGKNLFRRGSNAAQRVYQQQLSGLRPLKLASEEPTVVEDLDAVIAELTEARTQATAICDKYDKAHVRLAEQVERAGGLAVAELLLDSGYQINHSAFDLPNGKIETVRAEMDKVNKKVNSADFFDADLQAFERACERRLELTGAVLRKPELCREVPFAAAMVAELDQLGPALTYVTDTIPNLNAMSRRYQAIVVLLHNLAEEATVQANASFERHLKALRKEILENILVAGSTLAYPFPHANENISVSRYLCVDLPKTSAPGELIGAISNLIDNFELLYFRLFGRLAQICELVEYGLGLDPLPIPDGEATTFEPIFVPVATGERHLGNEAAVEAIEIGPRAKPELQLQPKEESGTAAAGDEPADRAIVELEVVEQVAALQAPPAAPVIPPASIPGAIPPQTGISDSDTRTAGSPPPLPSTQPEPEEEVAAEAEGANEQPVPQQEAATAAAGAVEEKIAPESDEEADFELGPKEPAPAPVLDAEPAIFGLAEIDGRFNVRRAIEETEWYWSYQGYDQLDSETVALIVVKPESPFAKMPLAQLRELFCLENTGHECLRASRHVGQVQAIRSRPTAALPVAAGSIFFVMEFEAVTSLRDYRRRGTGDRLSIDACGPLLMKVASLADHLASAGLAYTPVRANLIQVTKHRDVRLRAIDLQPANGDLAEEPRSQAELLEDVACIAYEVLGGRQFDGSPLAAGAVTFRAAKVVNDVLCPDGDTAEAAPCCMAFVAALIAADQIRLSDYFTPEQLDWLEEEGYGASEQIKLLTRLRGFDPRRDPSPGLVNDESLRTAVADDKATRSNEQRSHWLRLAVNLGFVAAAAVSLLIWRGSWSAPAPVITIPKAELGDWAQNDFTYQVAIRKSSFDWKRQVPGRTHTTVTRGNSKLYVYFQWLSLPSNGLNAQITAKRANGTVIYEDPQRQIFAHQYNGVYIPMHAKMPTEPIFFELSAAGKVVGTYTVEITNSPWSAWWMAPLILILWFVAYLGARATVLKEMLE